MATIDGKKSQLSCLGNLHVSDESTVGDSGHELKMKKQELQLESATI